MLIREANINDLNAFHELEIKSFDIAKRETKSSIKRSLESTSQLVL